MDCPVCGHPNPSGARLCDRCATPLANRCDRCGFENPAGFRFCGACGFRLDETGAAGSPALTTGALATPLPDLLPEAFAGRIAATQGREGGERREGTVLFLDLQGFTGFSERHDPEAVFERMDHYRRAFVAVIFAFEGSVDKFTGDGLMALFGVPVAHENDPERACHAALELQQTLLRLNEGLGAAGDTGLHGRIGIHTGPMVAGTLGPDLRMEYTVLGDTVNVAQRLESAAEPGTILLSEATWQRVAGHFLATDLGAVAVRGRDEPVRAFRLEGPQPLAQRRQRARAALPFVGREAALAALDGALARTGAGAGQVVLVTGEAGIGKSRLLAQWQARIPPADARVLTGASLSYRQPISYWPFLTILQGLFGIEESDSDAERWARLEAGLRAQVPEIAPTELLPFLAHFLSLPIPDAALAWQRQQLAPAQMRQQSFIALRVLLVSIAFQQPLVLVLEDLQWADSATLDLLVFLLGKTEAVPLQFILVSRPQDGPASERLARMVAEGGGRVTSLPLAPLGWADMERLVARWLAPDEGGAATGPALPTSFQELLLRRAGGNPFFLEELLESWTARGELVQAEGAWTLANPLAPERLAVPASLGALLRARLDRLPEAARRVLQLASVIGRTFPRALLVHIARQQPEPPGVDTALALLAAQGLVEPAGGDEWQFHHPLMRETVYEGLLHSERREQHALVASSLELLFRDGPAPERPTERAELVAFHYERAEAWERALPFLVQAAEEAAARFDGETALRYGTRALRLTDQTGAATGLRLRLHELLAEGHSAMGQWDAAERHLGSAAALAGQAESVAAPRRADIHRRLARLHERRGDYEAALRCLDDALAQLDAAPATGSDAERARILNDLGWIAFRQGNLQRAEALAHYSLALLEGGDHPHDLASAWNRLVAVCSAQGRWQEALDFAAKSLELREALGFQPGIAASCQTMAGLLLLLGQWQDGLQYVWQALVVAQAISSRATEGEALLLQATLQHRLGALDAARESAESAVALAEQVAQPALLLAAHRALAGIHLARGAMRAAHLAILQALEQGYGLPEPDNEAETHRLHADILLAGGHPRAALGEARQALIMAQEHADPLAEAAARRTLGGCLLALGDPSSAETHLRRALDSHQSLAVPYELALSQLALARLRHAQGDAEDAELLRAEAANTFAQLGAVVEIGDWRLEIERRSPLEMVE